MTNNGIQVVEGRTYLKVPHQGRTETFIAPAFGYDTYASIGNAISQANLQQPTMAQNASLVYAAWQNPTEKYSKDIISKMKTNWLWSFNGLLYVPNEGVYIADRPEIKDNSIVMNRSDLIKKLESNDKSVRFLSFDKIKAGEQFMYSALAKNKFVVALAGEEGAEKLAEVALNYKFNPTIWALTETSEEQKRVAGLSSDWSGVSGLGVDGIYGLGIVSGCAFGVSPVSEADARKK